MVQELLPVCSLTMFEHQLQREILSRKRYSVARSTAERHFFSSVVMGSKDKS